MNPIVKTTGLTKSYAGGAKALDGLTLELPRGRSIGLLGPNGSGKTTLVKLACGLLVPTAGEILVDGKRPGIETKRAVSYLPERAYFDTWMRARDCVELFADFYGDFNRDKARDMLADLGISPAAPIRSMSKGTREKLQLILVMSRAAQLYLLDEPIGGVDPAARDYILGTILSNYREDGTLVISTHLISDVERILDEVVFLNHGKLVLAAGVDELREREGKSVDQIFREVFRC